MGRQSKFAADSAEGKGVRMQYAALCWRDIGSGLEVLLITSRDTGRWVLPKGWPMQGLAPEMAAAQEAWEEAGVEGQVHPVGLGRYGYLKELGDNRAIPCAVVVYSLHVSSLADRFPERAERRREWFTPDAAANLVSEPELAGLIRGFVPPVQGRLPPVAARNPRD
ncbi:MAG: NUDIX hydrolase [Tabrizicola sp.]|nr:NUDIX hydrolase [Tabrizicola sp.]